MNANRQTAADREASLRRVAIVLSSLPAPVAAKLLSSFGQDKRMDLRRTMTTLSDVDALERKRALESFSGSMQQMSVGNSPTSGEPSDQLDVMGSGQPGNSATRIPSEAFSPTEDTSNVDPHHPLAFLSKVPDPQLIEILTAEHPQTVAVVLASVDPGKAAQLIPGLPRLMRDEIIRRIGRMTNVEPDTLSEVAELLRAKCLRIDLPRESSSGSHALRAILARMRLPEEDQASSSKHPTSSSDRTTQTETSAESPPRGTSIAIDELRLAQPGTNSAAASTNLPVSESKSNRNASLDLSAVDRIMSPGDESQSTAKTEGHNGQNSQQHVLSTDDINRRLQSLSPTQLCIALGRVDARSALLTLCGLPMKQANRAIAMLPKAQQKKTRAQLANLGPLQLAEIDRAKESVALASMPKTDSLAAA